jgi:hypothetical protein
VGADDSDDTGGTDDTAGREPARLWSAATVDVGVRRAHAPATAPAARPRSPFEPDPARFEVRGELGRGGMGRVDDAYDHALDRRVAIKHLLRAGEVDHARFEREARITARLEHPGIVPVHEPGVDPDGTPFYVMRRVDGRPLVDVVTGARAFADRLALLPNVLAACDAVAFAHARDIIHRDIKPANILIGRFGETLVIDWGLARELDPDAGKSGIGIPSTDGDLTVAGTIAGTPGFMSPEQARGEPVDARADVFALGATLFYVLAGAAPFRGTSATELIGSVGANRPPDWSALSRDVPPDLRAIVAKALASRAVDRYTDAGELASDLRRFVTGNLVDAHRYGAIARVARFVRRHRAVFAVAAASALVLAAIAVIAVRRVVAERDDATDARALAEARQREATDDTDQMLVDRARALALTDPVGAVLLLRGLPVGSARWRDAWLPAVEAWTRGVPFGFQNDTRVQNQQIAADGRHLVTSTASGVIAVYDLVARTRRVVRTLEHANNCQWLGTHEVACIEGATQSKLTIVDTDTGATRPVPLTVMWTVGDHASHVVVQTVENRLVMLDASGAVHELMRDAVLGDATADLSEIIVQQGHELLLWTPAGVRTIAPLGRDPTTERLSAIVRGDTIAALVDDAGGRHIVRWRVSGDRVVEDGRWPGDGTLGLALLDGHIFASVPDGIRAIDRGGGLLDLHPGMMFVTARGFGAIEASGAIGIDDDRGQVRVGPYPLQLVRAEVGRDGRFLIATGYLGEVLVWDLEQQRPRAVRTDGIEDPLGVSPGAVWTLTTGAGLTRHALPDHPGDGGAAADPGELVVPILAPPGAAVVAVARDGSWAAIRNQATDELLVYDRARGLHSPVIGSVWQQVSELPDGRDSLVIARPDGGVARWVPGARKLDDIGRFAKPPRGFACAEPYALAWTTDTELVRLELPAIARGTATFPAAIEDVAVVHDGRAWVVTDGGTLWRWDLDAAPVQMPTREPISSLLGIAGHVYARSTHTLEIVDTSPMHVFSLDVSHVAPLDDDYLAISSSTYAVTLLDVRSGTRIAMRFDTSNGGMTAGGSTIVIQSIGPGDVARLEARDLGAPHDPTALRAWLAAITNASPSAEGDGAVWPAQ